MEDTILHEGYSLGGLFDDIALVRLKEPAILNEGVGVACLPLDESGSATEYGAVRLDGDSLAGVNVTVAGWGKTSNVDLGTIKVIVTAIFLKGVRLKIGLCG